MQAWNSLENPAGGGRSVLTAVRFFICCTPQTLFVRKISPIQVIVHSGIEQPLHARSLLIEAKQKKGLHGGRNEMDEYDTYSYNGSSWLVLVEPNRKELVACSRLEASKQAQTATCSMEGDTIVSSQSSLLAIVLFNFYSWDVQSTRTE